ncbi:MAG: hypothetical protein HYX48_04095 [Chlamydiales bacterium]|nr:hypothetical protein [Chlamydiales bacterium]
MRLFSRKTFFVIFLLAVQTLLFTGCYQAHSDDDLRTVPSTNNPHIIGSSSPTRAAPGAAF